MKQPYGNSLPASPTVGDVMFLDDNTLYFCYSAGTWTAISGASGASETRQEYDSVPLAIAKGTADTQSAFIGLVRRQAPHIRSYTNYSQCKWDLWEFSDAGVAINSWSGQQFDTEADLYTFLAANAVVVGGFYDNFIVGLIYDVVDEESPRITKMYGMNTFYSLLRGRRNYKAGLSFTCADSDNIHWSGLGAWFEDLCQAGMGLPAWYTWNAADHAERVLWFPRSGSRKLYGLPPEGFTSAISTLGGDRNNWAWGTSSWQVAAVPNTYENDGGLQTIWCRLDKSAWSSTWDFITNPTRFMTSFNSAASWLRLYRLQRAGGGYNSVFVKPVGIDRIGFNWFDTTAYDLVAMYTKKDRTPIIDTMDVSSGVESRFNDLIWLESSVWWPTSFGTSGKLSYGSTTMKPNINFFLRDKTTGSISPLSKAHVQFTTNTRGCPFKTEIK